MRTTVVATAGHVDHGKSTLVRALTGMEPDRWEEEKRRELTIDLGYAWTQIENDTFAFVDVPGHRRFIGNMLAGLGPVAAVLFVVAADESWMPQSADHLAAAAALGVEHVVLVVTRADLADPAPAVERATTELTAAGLTPRQALAVSARTGEGLDELRSALVDLAASMPRPDLDARVRLWIDRAFTITGAGTVVTGTLPAGRLATGDTLELAGDGGRRTVTVRGVQSLDTPRTEVSAPARVAVNLRGVSAQSVHRGDALLTPGAWPQAATLDARIVELPGTDDIRAPLPEHLMLHAGTAAVQARVRPLGQADAGAVRLTLPHGLPLVAGDRAILREPGTGVITGVVILDVDPPPLRRRGAGARRGADLLTRDAGVDLLTELETRGHLTVEDARRLGVTDADLTDPPTGVHRHGDLLVGTDTWTDWGRRLRAATAAYAQANPLNPWMPAEAARTAIGLPRLDAVGALAAEVGLVHEKGRVHEPGLTATLGPAEEGLRAVEAALAAAPFAAPERPDLEAAGLGPRQIAAAVDAGRLIRLADDVLLQPIAPAAAMRLLAALPQPFTTSQARQALGTTRRVAIPLLEHLDARGWTRRLDAGHREVVR